jgi:hypothetical protein
MISGEFEPFGMFPLFNFGRGGGILLNEISRINAAYHYLISGI